MTSLPADDSWRTLIHYLCFALFPFVLPLFLISYIVSFLSFLFLSFCFLLLLRCFKCRSCLVLHSVRYLLSFPPFFSVFLFIFLFFHLPSFIFLSVLPRLIIICFTFSFSSFCWILLRVTFQSLFRENYTAGNFNNQVKTRLDIMTQNLVLHAFTSLHNTAQSAAEYSQMDEIRSLKSAGNQSYSTRTYY